MKFHFKKTCVAALVLKEKLISTPIIISPNWNESFEVMCDASGMALGVVLWKKNNKFFHLNYYASKTLNNTQQNYTITEEELLAVVYTLEKFWAYLLGTKVIVYIDHETLHYLMRKNNAKPILIRWLLVLQEFDFEVQERKGCENQMADHLSKLENQGTIGQITEIHNLFGMSKYLLYASQTCHGTLTLLIILCLD